VSQIYCSTCDAPLEYGATRAGLCPKCESPTTTESLGWAYTFEDNAAHPGLSQRVRGWRLGNPHGVKELWFDASVFSEAEVRLVQTALRTALLAHGVPLPDAGDAPRAAQMDAARPVTSDRGFDSSKDPTSSPRVTSNGESAPRLGGVEALMQAKVAPALDAAAQHFPASAPDGLRAAAQEYMDETGHARHCKAVRGPGAETWIDESKGCDCGLVKLRAALGSAPRGTPEDR